MVHLPLIAHVEPHDKKWSSSQSLNCYVAVSAQFLKTKDPAQLVVLAKKGPRIIREFTSLFDSQSNQHQSFVSHSADSQKRDKHLVTANKVRFQHANALKFIYITFDRGC